MPFQEVGDAQGGLGTLIGLAGGYLASNPQRKAAKANADYERAEKSKADSRADQELALNVQAVAQNKTEWDAKQQQEQLREGTLANIAKQIPQPTSDPIKDPGSWQKYFLQVANQLRAFPADAKIATDAAATVGRALLYDTQGGLNQARVPLIGAQTAVAKATAKDIPTRHEDRVMSAQDRLAIAQTVAQTSLIRAQIASSAADRRAAEATARAQMAIAASLQREVIREDREDTRQDRGFKHADAMAAKKGKGALKPDAQMAGQVRTLRAEYSKKQAEFAKAGQPLDNDAFRVAAKKDGYSDPEIDQVIPRTPPPAAAHKPAAAAPAAPNPIGQFFGNLLQGLPHVGPATPRQ